MTNGLEVSLLLVIIALLVNQRRPTKLTGRTACEMIVDSCGLIDGRIVEIVEAGFVHSDVVIPQFIIHELQLLADGRDAQKRLRARYGLDVAQKLQNLPHVRTIIDHADFADIPTIDDKLIALAKKRRASLYTVDYTLSKVVSLEGITVLNVNDLAQRLRPALLPGEVVMVTIVQRGSTKSQGVGYLADGTMVVVDNAAKYCDKQIEVVVDRMHQTASGRMIFARFQRTA